MRASTLFGLTIAILIGLGVVFGVKSMGFFDRKAPVAEVQRMPLILVAGINMMEGITYSPNQVIIRPVSVDELTEYNRNKHKFMPPVPEAINFRVLARYVTANEPLLKEHFQDFKMPEAFKDLLGPNMRALNLELPKASAAGGVIRKDDRVDVFLTTRICGDPACSTPQTATAALAFGVRVAMKRNSYWTTLAPVNDGPVAFTLEVNPYRAALIEFAKSKGQLTLFPTGPSRGLKDHADIGDTKEEELRVQQISRGVPITNMDLEDIFKLSPMTRLGAGMEIERWGSVDKRKSAAFPAPGPFGIGAVGPLPNVPNMQHPNGRGAMGYQFSAPDTAGCQTAPAARKG